MRSAVLSFLLAIAVAVPALAYDKKEGTKTGKAEWSMNATIIEACSCPMFCQCYFGTKPASHAVAGHGEHAGHGHGEEHYCRFNNAIQVNKGHYGAVKLDGAKVWLYGDLGAEFDDGEMDWAVAVFDRSLSREQRDAIGKILGHVYPVKWKSFTTAEGEIVWVSGKDESYALLDGGRTAEVRLSSASLSRNNKGEAMVIKNLKYWGVPRNDGFVLMPNTVEAVRTGDRRFEYKGTNGFMITFDINANDVAPAGKSGM